MLIVELLIIWIAISCAFGLPLGRAIRRADIREFPLRDSPWWCDVTDDRRELDLSRLGAGALPA